MSDKGHLPVLCVLGTWSSGTTAVTGYLKRLGAYSCPPHIKTNDPRTPDSYESLQFRNQCAATVSETTFADIGDRQAFQTRLQSWTKVKSDEAALNECSHLVLKHPLSAFLISEIHQVCTPRWIVVTRPFNKIEATRHRRKWFPNYGALGAKKIYSTIFSALIEIEASYLAMSFADFLSSSAIRDELSTYSGITTDVDRRARAEEWIR